MGCGSCSTGGGCAPSGCKSNGSCLTGGCQKMEVYDWLSNLDMPSNYKPFQVIEVKFKGARKEFYLNTDNIYLEIGELIAVEGSTGGYDIGHVSLTGELVRMQMKRRKTPIDQVTRKVYRKATEADVDKWKLAKDLEWETMHKARTLALDLRLSMKISDVDYQGDKTKATFFYTAEGRVDFRELIKKMAETFRIRIEMRQIGMRQEAGRLGGIGSCGRELCCSTWLTNFKTVSTAAARYQNLSLNTLKLAGQCGKLKCCLNYELDTYLDALKDIPDRIESLHTEVGTARHQKTDIFKKLMWFSYPNQEDWIPLKVDRVKEIMAMNKKGQKPSNLKDEAVELATTVIVEKVHDYENVVGQDSLTRLDDKRNKNNRNNNTRNKNAGTNRPERERERSPKPAQSGSRSAQQNQKPVQQGPKQAQQGPRTAQQGSKPVQQGPKQAQQGARAPQQGPKVRPEATRVSPEGIKTEEGAETKAPSASRNNRSRNNRRRNKPTDKPKNEEN
ncbi:Cell fate regulator YaaT, PSP1 superfamily (controls sporulation, competence, biofilm development) [Pedobacter westerhofensis]|uniref:Cell fate regulator YaaT, PSP1 superfamily (Controls sporulation, competence, biofilm development) n=1 Tax=Pedobacter westerhofensis TaxID=425512 RepID=A0A521DWZ4_9SPHI|nr:regulatory iron-sulfur-containing complex subunit RicT [Pedobacter westerhofensis]SMO75390.1 Cell fate regulator YaaT, PSP1 superfamily (controls sporulation, competence, biofilm development) [Pedobacter westerhofensis]